MGSPELHSLLQKLRGVQQAGQNQWSAKCPAHEDNDPSLSISTGMDGRILLHCHVGCPVEQICGALEITVADLFPWNRNSKGKIVAAYKYRDEGGTLLYEVVRYEPKNFKQRRPDQFSNDGWIWNIRGVRRVLYRLPEIVKAITASKPILIAEGEKDVDALVKQGYEATCNTMGAGKWKKDYSESLRSATVVIIPDNDKAGISHAHAVFASLRGIAQSTKIVSLPNGKDPFDFFEQGGTADELQRLIHDTPEQQEPSSMLDVLPGMAVDAPVGAKAPLVSEEAIDPDTLLYETLQARRFVNNSPPTELRAIYTLKNIAICTPGNLQAITAPPKAGKSAFLNAMLAASIANDASCDTFGINSENPHCYPILHFDTEQSEFDHWDQMERVLRRARLCKMPPWVESYHLAGLTVPEIVKAVGVSVRSAFTRSGGIHSVLIDGVGDLVSDVNDPIESNALIAVLHRIALEYDCAVCLVLHLNPGSVKGRGHLGSQIERKAETNLRMEMKNGVTHVWSDKQRRAPIRKGEGPSFRWDDEAGMHVSVESYSDQKAKLLKELLVKVFGENEVMRRSDMISEVQKLSKVSESTAKRTVLNWVQHRLISKTPQGRWKRTT
jgi:hypothetical protein